MESKSWKEIQQKTFTRWVSQRLKVKHLSVNDLSTDFADGVLLYSLMGILSQKDLGKYNARPRIQVQKMENLQKVLKFIENEEKIRLVNIGAGDIHDGNLKLILGLVWALILHYQISSINLQEDGTANISGKQVLLQYIKDKIPHKNIKNFTSDWSNGTAVAALVDAHAPGLCPEADTMDPNNGLENTTIAMNLAEEWLGIPQVLSPEDMISMYVDELSVMTYLSQYPKAVLRSDAPITDKVIEEDFQVIDTSLVESELPMPVDESKVKIYGPGITGDNVQINKPAMVSIDCTGSGVLPLAVSLQTPDGLVENIEFQQSSLNPEIFEASYVPSGPGKYILTVKYNRENLESKPYVVDVTDQSQVTVSGSGVTGHGAIVGKPAYVIADCSKSGIGKMHVKIETTAISGAKWNRFTPQENEPAIFESWYIPTVHGLYTITVEFNGLSISEKPYRFYVYDIDKVKVSGSGVSGHGLMINKPAQIIVDCSESGVAPVTAKVKYPSGTTQDVSFQLSKERPNVCDGFYKPTIAGVYEVAIEFNGRLLSASPVKVSINDITKVKVSGSGITGEGARVGKPANVVVDCSDSGVVPVAVKVTDPSGNTEEIPLHPKSNSSSVFEGFYTPKDAGNYEAEVKFDGEAVPDSPYQVAIGKPECVRISGDGLDKAFVGEDNVIDVFTEDAGPGNVSVKFSGPPRAGPVVENVVKVDDNHYQVHFSPQDAGVYDCLVCFDNFEFIDKHRIISAIDLESVRITGPCIDSKVEIAKETFLNIETPSSSRLGIADLSISIVDESGIQVSHEIQELSKDSHKLLFTPLSKTNHTVDITFAGRQLNGSPFVVNVAPDNTHSKTKRNPSNPEYSITAPLHIVAMVIMVGLMDHTVL